MAPTGFPSWTVNVTVNDRLYRVAWSCDHGIPNQQGSRYAQVVVRTAGFDRLLVGGGHWDEATIRTALADVAVGIVAHAYGASAAVVRRAMAALGMEDGA